MNNILTAIDAVNNAISRIGTGDYVIGKVVSRKQFPGTDIYQYCPFCVKRIKEAGLDYKQELRPLWIVRYKELYAISPNEGRIIYNTYWECDFCRDTETQKAKKITVEDFCNFSVKDGTHNTFQNLKINLKDKKALESF